MKYQVLETFQEKEHKDTVYYKGVTYPKAGFEAKTDRVAYLQSDKNSYKRSFLGEEVIEEVEGNLTNSEEEEKAVDEINPEEKAADETNNEEKEVKKGKRTTAKK